MCGTTSLGDTIDVSDVEHGTRRGRVACLCDSPLYDITHARLLRRRRTAVKAIHDSAVRNPYRLVEELVYEPLGTVGTEDHVPVEEQALNIRSSTQAQRK